MVHFLSFPGYGSPLHGADAGSFERRATGTQARPAHRGFAAARRRTMVQEPFLLTSEHRPGGGGRRCGPSLCGMVGVCWPFMYRGLGSKGGVEPEDQKYYSV